MIDWRLFFRDIRREWRGQSPSCYGSRVWIRLWQHWRPGLRAGRWMRFYLWVILAPADFVDRLYRHFVRQRELKRWNARR